MFLNYYRKYIFRKPLLWYESYRPNTIPVFYNDSAITIYLTHCNPENPWIHHIKRTITWLRLKSKASHRGGHCFSSELSRLNKKFWSTLFTHVIISRNRHSLKYQNQLETLNKINLRTEVYQDFLDEEGHNDIYIVFVFFPHFYDDNNDLHRVPESKS